MAKSSTPAEVQAFIAKIAPHAIESWKQTHIMLPSITIAQAGLESGWGKSELSMKANNFFGIKVSNGWTGDSIWIVSPEVINGQTIMKNSLFRKYANITDNLNDHNEFFVKNKKRYGNIIGNTDFNQVRILIQRDGYATDPEYPAKLLKLYNTHNLGQYDVAAGITPGTPVQQQTQGNTSSTTTVKTIYAVQTGAYKKPENAQGMLQKVKASGFDAYIVKMGNLYKVQIGAFANRSNADRRLAEVKAKGFDAIIAIKKQ